MRNLRILAALGLLTAAGAANAGISSTWTATSDYDFRGFTQTDEDPALQASLDFSTDSGWYIGTWASNVDFPGYDGSLEVDLYTGFSGGAEDGLGWDVGLIWYNYPGSDSSETESKIPDFPEIYGKLSYGIFSGKVWYSNDFGGSDQDAMYVQGDASIPLPANFTIDLHAGYSFGDYWKDADSEYVDYSAGVGYTVGNFTLGLKYVDTDLKDTDMDRVIFTVSTTFPWGT
ncbi:MAG: TorF family putative porin [Povalibacter sp.]